MQILVGGVFGHGADNETAPFLGRQQPLHFLAQQFALGFILDALRNTDMRILRKINQHAARDRNLGRQPCAFCTDRILDHLHEKRLSIEQQFFDRQHRRRRSVMRTRFPDVGYV